MCSAEPEPAEPPDDGAFESFRRAELQLHQRRPLEALRELEPALNAQPDAPSVLLVAGLAYFRSAQLGRAERALTRLVGIDPADHYARFVLGRTLQRQGRLVEAKAQLQLAFAMSPKPEYQDSLSAVTARVRLGDT